MLRLQENLTLGQAVKWLRAHDFLSVYPSSDGNHILVMDHNRGDQRTFYRRDDDAYRLSEIDAWLEYDQPSK